MGEETDRDTGVPRDEEEPMTAFGFGQLLGMLIWVAIIVGVVREIAKRRKQKGTEF